MTIGIFLLIGTYALFNEKRTLLERRGIRGERVFTLVNVNNEAIFYTIVL